MAEAHDARVRMLAESIMVERHEGKYVIPKELVPEIREFIGPFCGPDPNARSYRWGVTWRRVEPVTPIRCESAEAALASNSDFRRMVDRLDPELATVTLWVYPDSFALYRQLRDYLADRGLTVAGRPMPEGMAIGFSPRGSASRGQ